MWYGSFGGPKRNRSTPPEVHSSWEKQASQPMKHRRVGTPSVRTKTAGVLRPRAWHPVLHGHWPQEDISQAPWCHSMWTLKRRRREGKGRSSIHDNHTLICHPCYTCHLTESSYPQELLLSLYRHRETGLPRLKNSPSHQAVCMCSL